MKKVLLIVGLLCVLCSSVVYAEAITQDDILLIKSSNKSSEIPIELNSIQYKEFIPNINDMDDISIKEDFKLLNLLSNKIKSAKSDLLSSGEISYKQKEKD